MLVTALNPYIDSYDNAAKTAKKRFRAFPFERHVSLGFLTEEEIRQSVSSGEWRELFRRENVRQQARRSRREEWTVCPNSERLIVGGVLGVGYVSMDICTYI